MSTFNSGQESRTGLSLLSHHQRNFFAQQIGTNTKPDTLHRMIDLSTLSTKGQVSIIPLLPGLREPIRKGGKKNLRVRGEGIYQGNKVL